MRYNKQTQDDYIIGIGTGDGGEEITREEYEETLAVILAKPTAAEGFALRLRSDLTWEEYEVPPVEPVEPDEPVAGEDDEEVDG